MEYVQPIRDIKKIEAMKKVLKNGPHGPRNYLLFVLGINSGLRISDLLNLKLKDVLNGGNKIRDNITLRERKTNKTKQFAINKAITKALSLYLEPLSTINIEQYLFKSKKGDKPISRNQAWEILNNAAQAVGIEESIGTHSLRKTFGYHAFKSGVGIERLQTILNHSSPAITLRYIGITQDDIDNVYLNLNL